MIKKRLFVFVLFLGASTAGFATKGIYTPKVGSIERKQIISALKTHFKSELRKPVKISVTAFKNQNDWSFIRGVILDKSGKSMNYKGTPYQEAVQAGIFDDWFCSLLYREKGKWRVMTYAIGATDVPYVDWANKYSAPPGIFK
jgi:hypothetical protein